MRYLWAVWLGVMIGGCLWQSARIVLATIELNEMTHQYQDMSRIYRYYSHDRLYIQSREDLKKSMLENDRRREELERSIDELNHNVELLKKTISDAEHR